MSIPIILDMVVGRVSEYDLTIKSGGEYTLVLPGMTEKDVMVEGLTPWNSVYGDELMPIIMHLKTNSEVVPYVSILTSSIFDQDDLLLTELDPYYLADIYQTDKENARIILRTTADIGQINQFIYPEPNDITMTITADDAAGLETYLTELVNEIGISCDTATLVGISYLRFSDVNMVLKSTITQNVSKHVFLHMDECSLRQLDHYMLSELDDISLDRIEHVDLRMRLTQSIFELGVTYLLPQSDMTISLSTNENTGAELLSTVKLNDKITLQLSQSSFMPHIDTWLSCENDIVLGTSAYVKNESMIAPIASVSHMTIGMDNPVALPFHDDLTLVELDPRSLVSLDSNDYIHLRFAFNAANTASLSGTVDIDINATT